jgi:hypothetical protein
MTKKIRRRIAPPSFQWIVSADVHDLTTMFVTVEQLFAVLKKRRLWQAVVFQKYGSVDIGKYKIAPAHNTAVTANVFTAEPLYEFAGPCDVS